MKKVVVLFVLASFLVPAVALAAGGDLVLSAGNIQIPAGPYLEGKTIRIYATVSNPSSADLRGVVRFFDGDRLIQGDQSVSVLSKKDDSVFIDWIPGSGNHTLKINLVPFDPTGDNPANNTFIKEFSVLMDTDRDGIANNSDPDDDNDGVLDAEDAFPLDKKEWLDTDGDGKGNNSDPDDDNDGTPDAEDALPLDYNEQLDTDKDGIGNNADEDDDGDGIKDDLEIELGTDPLNPDTDGDGVNDFEDKFPLDPTQTRDMDKDGISDERDNDADGDGIEKSLDVNDLNRPPHIVLSIPSRFVVIGREIIFSAKESSDADGTIAKIVWSIDGKTLEDGDLTRIFTSQGRYPITVTLTDDKGESATEIFTIYALHPAVPWIIVGGGFILVILAIFLLFSYSRRRYQKRLGVVPVMTLLGVAKVLIKRIRKRSKS